MSEATSIESATEELERQFASARCSSEDVATCTRCNVMYLVRVAQRAGPFAIARLLEGVDA